MRSDDFRRTLQRAPVDLAELLHNVVDKVQPFVRSRNLRLKDAVSGDLGVFEIDGDKIDACTVNLLTNAIKFTPDGKEITLAARLAGPDEAEITVSDSGIGLDERSLRQLFQPFFTQFDSSHHSSGDFGFNKRGLGLGLSIVKQFIDLHGGSVSAESGLGVGTAVTIRLPRRCIPAREPSALQPTAGDGETAPPVPHADAAAPDHTDEAERKVGRTSSPSGDR
jgi:signal transduction histidine kinase